MKKLTLFLSLATCANYAAAQAPQVNLAHSNQSIDWTSSSDIFSNDSLKPVIAVVEIQDKNCPNGEYLPDLCSSIGGRNVDVKGEFRYHYQRIIYESACVTKDDTEEEKIAKIQKMWLKYQDKLICNNTKFNVLNGNVLKYAVRSLFEDFLYDVTLGWKVDLNKVDKFDNKTVLDYVKTEIERNEGTGIEGQLKSYYELLRAEGAKHRYEL